jgi:hypothetical protein
MAANQTEVVAIVKVKMELTESDNDALIDLYVDEIGQRILNYCNLPDIPDGLKYTWASMVAMALTAEQSSVLYPPVEVVEAFEIKLGDTTVKQIKNPSSATVSRPSVVVIDSVIFDYQGELNSYRKLRW